jgi:hypothetical protein
MFFDKTYLWIIAEPISLMMHGAGNWFESTAPNILTILLSPVLQNL